LETVEVFDLLSVSKGSNGIGGGGSFATLTFCFQASRWCAIL